MVLVGRCYAASRYELLSHPATLMLVSPVHLKVLEGPMPNMEEHLAAMAARMIDAEIASIIRRLPAHKEPAPFHQAVLREAERRGLLASRGDNQLS